jgi:hypothetical protein
MTVQSPSQKSVDALLEFYKDCGIDLAKIKAEAEARAADEPGDTTAETPQYHSLSARVSAANLKNAKTSCLKLQKTFGESLRLTVGIEEWPARYIEIKGEELKREDFEGIEKYSGELNLEISIDKSALIRKLKLDETRYTCFFYLFEENLVSFLSAPVLELDELLFPETSPQAGGSNQTSASDKPVLIVLSQADVHFAGEMLTIVGEADPGLLVVLQGQPPGETQQLGASATAKVEKEKPKGFGVHSVLTFVEEKVFRKKAATSQQAGPPPAPGSGTLREEIQKYLTATTDTPSFINGQFKHLTPLHFLGKWIIKHSILERVLAIHFVNICILYTANRSTFDGDKNALISVYNGLDRTTSLSLKDPPTSEVSTNALESLAQWIYEVKGTDRRTVFQNIIAREVYADDPKVSYNDFITRAPRLLKDAKWQYQVFIDGKIDKHFDELQKVIGYVTEINKKISEAIDSVTKSLTDALLATVGVLVLTVLAALVKKDTSIEIFMLSMAVYSAYLVFYALYRMGSIWGSYRLLSKEASAQLRRYQSTLRIEEITDLSSSLRKRRWQFHKWFWLTVILYLALAGLILWAGKRGPQLLIDRGIITAPDAKKPEASSSVCGKILHEQRFTC